MVLEGRCLEEGKLARGTPADKSTQDRVVDREAAGDIQVGKDILCEEALVEDTQELECADTVPGIRRQVATEENIQVMMGNRPFEEWKPLSVLLETFCWVFRACTCIPCLRSPYFCGTWACLSYLDGSLTLLLC
jgi:hypothetical protein